MPTQFEAAHTKWWSLITICHHFVSVGNQKKDVFIQSYCNGEDQDGGCMMHIYWENGFNTAKKTFYEFMCIGNRGLNLLHK